MIKINYSLSFFKLLLSYFYFHPFLSFLISFFFLLLFFLSFVLYSLFVFPFFLFIFFFLSALLCLFYLSLPSPSFLTSDVPQSSQKYHFSFFPFLPSSHILSSLIFLPFSTNLNCLFSSPPPPSFSSLLF